MTTAKRPSARLRLSEARNVISKIWFSGAGVAGLVLAVLSILRGQADVARDTWSWFLPLVLPTLGLIIGVLGAAALTTQKETYVRRSYYELAKYLSLAYFLLMLLVIFMEPLSPLKGTALYGVSNYWMSPFQALVTAALGYMFTSGQAQMTSKPGEEG
ncbi:MAG: hypothetical protein ABL934_00645 [Lysobacteraceae bacterium]